MNKHLILLLACIWASATMAQTPKWVDKAKRAVCTVMTYDKNGTLLATTNGTFVGAGGVAISDYTSFKGAAKAVFINTEGQELPVQSIIGVNTLYDVVKLRVTTNKNTHSLSAATTPAATGEQVWLLPYSPKKERIATAGTVTSAGKAGNDHAYYTLQLPLSANQVSCPIVNANGEVLGITQAPTDKQANNTCYAVGISLPMAIEVNMMGFNDKDLQAIGIRKALPATEEQALVYLFMASTSVPQETYAALLDEFVQLFPNSADGYLRRASYHVGQALTNEAELTLADADLKRAQEVSTDKADILYNRARLIHGYILQSSKHEQPGWTAADALQSIRAAIAASPQPIYYDLEGDICFMLKDYKGAFAAYQQVEKTIMSSADNYYKMAKACQMTGADLKDVVAWMDSCVNKLKKPYSEADAGYLLERAQINMDLEQYRAAMLDYDEYYYAVSGKVNDVFYYYREQASLGARQYQRALDDINTAIEMDPKNHVYSLELGAINLRVGRYEEALKALQTSIQLNPTGDAYRLMGMAQIQLKQKAAACESFAKAKELGDTLVDALIEKNCK